ncbi:MAG: hypothetical protein ACI9W6_001044 [Motiliproteus sp.]|jgi:hypothetical protein
MQDPPSEPMETGLDLQGLSWIRLDLLVLNLDHFCVQRLYEAAGYIAFT